MLVPRAEDGRVTSCVDAFVAFSQSIADGVLIKRVSRQDKEFHFQNWVGSRLDDAGVRHDQNGRNSYPDFTLVDYPEGFEVKGLAWPGREANYDSNSRVPSGHHNGRTVFYVFGRYPAKIDEDSYPVVDLVMCHGDFLNADHDYIHKNKSFRGFGSYGDLLVRDRKMYVAPTPFALTEGTTGQHTLIVPAGYTIDDPRVDPAGELVRVETAELVVGYSFDLMANTLEPKLIQNPHAGQEHHFRAYRRHGVGCTAVSLRANVAAELPFDNGGDDNE
jgi:hypothetical protein